MLQIFLVSSWTYRLNAWRGGEFQWPKTHSWRIAEISWVLGSENL